MWRGRRDRRPLFLCQTGSRSRVIGMQRERHNWQQNAILQSSKRCYGLGRNSRTRSTIKRSPCRTLVDREILHDTSRICEADPREEHFRIPSHHAGLSLFLRYLPALRETQAHKNVVLYIHGGTFPSELSIAHRFDGVSWRDELAASGFHCWGLDFHGFGRLSDPYPEMSVPAEQHPPLGRANDASRQLERAVRFICAHHRVSRISLLAHSWGGIVAGRFAGEHPRLVERLVFFGPIASRPRRADSQRLPGGRVIFLHDT